MLRSVGRFLKIFIPPLTRQTIKTPKGAPSPRFFMSGQDKHLRDDKLKINFFIINLAA